MSVFEKIKEMRADYRRNADTKMEYNLLTVLVGELETDSKRSGKEVICSEVFAKIKKFMKGNAEVMNSSDEVRANAAKMENAFLSTLLPATMSEDEIRAVLSESIFGNVGEAQKLMQEKHPGMFDRALVAKIAKEFV